MKLLGWILTILGGMSCLGALRELANGKLMIHGVTFLAIGISVAILIIGLMILNHKKK